ncbi:MAG: NAD-dependent epimerase/dehydratase family protein [Acidimicrobiales bacterium]
MKALVTGVGGFVGAHLAARLVGDGWDVAGTVRPGGSQARLVDLGLRDAIDVFEADLGDPRATAAAGRAARVDVAFLLAAARAEATPAERGATTAVNSAGAVWLVDALGDQCHAVVRLGSSTEYAQMDGPIDETAPVAPQSFFGATKAAGSLLLVAAAARRGVRSAVLRAFQVYGPLDHAERLVPTALRAAHAGTTLPLTEPGRCRDWVYVDDVVECCVRAALADDLSSGQVLNVGTGRQTTNEGLVAEIVRVTGRSVDVTVGAHGGRQWDAPSWVSDPSRPPDLLGWEAKVDLAGGLARCWEARV